MPELGRDSAPARLPPPGAWLEQGQLRQRAQINDEAGGMSTVAQLPRRAAVLLTKKQLAAEINRSERWIELKHREGLPIASTDRFGRRRYSLAAVQTWMHSEPARPRSTDERLAELERQVAELRAMIERGQ